MGPIVAPEFDRSPPIRSTMSSVEFPSAGLGMLPRLRISGNRLYDMPSKLSVAVRWFGFAPAGFHMVAAIDSAARLAAWPDVNFTYESPIRKLNAFGRPVGQSTAMAMK